MKIKKDGTIFETENEFVISQLLKYGGVEFEEPKKEIAKEEPKKK